MKNILLLLVIGGVLLTHLPVRAENLLYYEPWRNYYRADTNIKRVVIDSDFSEQERDTILSQYGHYIDIEQVVVRSVNTNSRRDNNTLTIVKNLGGQRSYFSSGSLYKQVGNTRYYTNPMIHTNLKAALHELGHYLGLYHTIDDEDFVKRKGKRRFKKNDLVLGGIACLMSYGSNARDHDLQEHGSDIFYFNLQAYKEKNFVKLTGNLEEYNGAELVFLPEKQKITAVNIKKGEHVTYPDSYSTAIGMVQRGGFDITLPRLPDTYEVYVFPSNNTEQIPNPKDISGLEKPLYLGAVKIKKNGEINFSKKLKKHDIQLLYTSRGKNLQHVTYGEEEAPIVY